MLTFILSVATLVTIELSIFNHMVDITKCACTQALVVVQYIVPCPIP